jgi:hypothetical protein
VCDFKLTMDMIYNVIGVQMWAKLSVLATITSGGWYKRNILHILKVYVKKKKQPVSSTAPQQSGWLCYNF